MAEQNRGKKADAAALALARVAYETLQPEAAILFGSRARGDHEERRSDIDVMLIVQKQPDQSRKDEIKDWAEDRALAIYGKPVPVQLVWFDRNEYEEQEKFVNTVVTRALREGVVMSTTQRSTAAGTTTGKLNTSIHGQTTTTGCSTQNSTYSASVCTTTPGQATS